MKQLKLYCHVLFHYNMHAFTKFQGCIDFLCGFFLSYPVQIPKCGTVVKGSSQPVASELSVAYKTVAVV